jgi:hypothetical protein
VVRELRPEEEVFREDSLATLSGAPVTRLHPPEGMVNPTNAKKLSIGFTGESIERRDALLGGTVTIMDAAAIADVASGKLRDFSMGYRCRIEKTAGVHPVHGRYDQIQRDIRYNHAALGGAQWGRAGSDVGIRMDSSDDGGIQRHDAFSALELFVNQQMDLQGMQRHELAERAGLSLLALEDVLFGFTVPTKSQLSAIASAMGVEVDALIGLVPRVDSNRRNQMEEETIVIGGVEFKVPKNAAQAVKAEAQRKDARISELEAEAEKLQGRFDAQSKELETSKAKVAELDSSDRFDSAVVARVELVAKARRVLGSDAEIKGTDREIKESVLKHDSKDLELGDKSDDYVSARFDHMMENFRSDKAKKSKKETRAAVDAATKGGERQDSDSARDRMREESAKAWQHTNRADLMG